MRRVVKSAIALSGATTWLLILEATDFNGIAVGMGLLVVLGVMDRVHEVTH